MCSAPFAYGGPSCSRHAAAPARSASWRVYSAVVRRPTAAGSRATALARMGNGVCGSASEARRAAAETGAIDGGGGAADDGGAGRGGGSGRLHLGKCTICIAGGRRGRAGGCSR